MFEYSFGLMEEAKAITTAMEKVLNAGLVTADLGGSKTTEQAGTAVVEAI